MVQFSFVPFMWRVIGYPFYPGLYFDLISSLHSTSSLIFLSSFLVRFVILGLQFQYKAEVFLLHFFWHHSFFNNDMLLYLMLPQTTFHGQKRTIYSLPLSKMLNSMSQVDIPAIKISIRLTGNFESRSIITGTNMGNHPS